MLVKAVGAGFTIPCAIPDTEPLVLPPTTADGCKQFNRDGWRWWPTVFQLKKLKVPL